MHKTFVLIIVIATLVFALSAIASNPEAAPMTTEILSATPQATLVRCIFDEPAPADAFTSGHIPDAGKLLLAVAPEGTPMARVLQVQLGEPLAGVLSENLPESVEELVAITEPGVLHDLRVVAVHIHSAMNVSGEVRPVRSIDIEIVTQGVGGANPKTPPKTFSHAFYPLYKAVVGNLDELYPEVSLGAPGRFAIIGPSSWISNIPSSWLEWKQRKGYEIVLAPYSVMSDSSITGIRNYISALYHEPGAAPLEYAILLGDVTGFNFVPSYRVQNPSSPGDLYVADNPLFTVDGEDYLPDVFHGRVSVATATEIVTIFNKVTNYEKSPYMDDPAWFTRGIGIGGNFNDCAGTFPVTPVWNTIWAREQLLDWVYTNIDTFYWRGWIDGPPNEYTFPITNAWNSGVSIVIYRGWGNARGWQYPVLLIEDLSNIQCGRQMPVLFSIVCASGDFGNTSANPCFGEKFLRMGSPNQPNGIIGFFGASDLHTNTRQNNAILAGCIEGMRFGSLKSFGAITLAGELEMWRSFPDQTGDEDMVEFYFDVFNVLGDPETHLWLGEPLSLEVSAPANVGTGENWIPVTVTAGGQPLESAVVTITGTELQSTLMTDADGTALIPVRIQGQSPLTLTAWKAGYLPVEQDIAFASGNLELSVIYENYSGGGNEIPNPGETVSLSLTIGNMGAAVSGVQAELTSLDPKVTVTSGSYTFGDIAASAEATQTTPFVIELNDDIHEGEEPQLQVRFTDDAQHVTDRVICVPVRAPLLAPKYIYADDANGILDPGETADMIVNITNYGRQDGDNVTATLYSWDESIEILDGEGNWGTIAAGDSGLNNENKFQIRAESGVTRGRSVVLRFDITANGIFQGTRLMLMTVGQVEATDPTGPDEYGYWAYEDLDVGFSATPTYNWIELDPAYGGSSDQRYDMHDEDMFDIDLPAPFTYYGESYDHIWVCSNGWFSFGHTRLPEFRNWPLPAPIGAPALVAPMWDDLNQWNSWEDPEGGTFAIFTRYDAGDSRFIIEWSRSTNRYGRDTQINNEETFEVILEYSGGEEDGSLLFQYLAAINVDENNNYFTVGIEDYEHQRGLNLTYANNYPVSMHEVTANRAIRITTETPDTFSNADDTPAPLPDEFALHAPYPNPFNPTTTLNFDLPRAAEVKLQIFDVLGREIATLVSGMKSAGNHTMQWNASEFSTGLYFVRFEAESFVQARKLLLVK